MKIVVVSGGFDPIHSGHLALLREASGMGDKLIVGVNSDAWLTRKKGKPFMDIHERKAILESIRWVDEVWEFDDSDGTACKLLYRVRNHHQSNTSQYFQTIQFGLRMVVTAMKQIMQKQVFLASTLCMV
jgi:cytidyltransferase-like protein